ncbi:MAG: hypothetical protein K0R39_1286 [Symbiobacteriaceae bacterium]|nr:hypothetical protein [Symbiobacteriaceae bacterium]
MPLAATGGGAALMYYLSRSQGGASSTHMLITIPLMAASYVWPATNFLMQKRNHRNALRDREVKYTGKLDAYRQTLEEKRTQYRRELLKASPDPAECLQLVKQRNARLWERTPRDGDFLALRLGLGAVPFGMTIKVPGQDTSLDTDPLTEAARSVGREFVTVPEAPVVLPLQATGPIGLSGPRHAVLGAMRSLVLQLTTLHSPDEIKLAAVYPEAETEEWDWLRWLPHTWSDDRRRRFLAAGPDESKRLLTDLHEIIKQRKLQAGPRDGAQKRLITPALVVLLDPVLSESEPVYRMALEEGPSLGIFPVILADRREVLPKECRGGFVELTANAGRMTLTGAQQTQTAFQPDEVSLAVADEFSRSMAPVKLQKMASADEIPSKVSLLELLSVNRVEDIHVTERWQQNSPVGSLRAPIGMRAGGEPLFFDVHEKGHGPHGLVAGATGSGKSELLQAIITAMALTYHPHEVTFVLIDFKGGGLAQVFEGMPHLIGSLSNLEAGMVTRAMASLDAELERRQRLLGNQNIDEYIKRRRHGGNLPPLAHMVLVVDEFAQLKSEYPEFMKKLISAARVGRSLGVHLILATQKPAGVVDEQIWSNSRFRLCLRVERPEDSQEVLKCPDAANLRGAGRGYIQVGNNEMFELFQSGYGGLAYTPDAAPGNDPEEIALIRRDGSRSRLTQSTGAVQSQGAMSQQAALVACTRDEAKRAGICPLPGPWLEPLPESVALPACRSAEGWNGQGWNAAAGWIQPVVGRMDNPVEQLQAPLSLPLGRDGHLAIYGGPGSGKTTFLQTLVISLALTHSPAAVQVYLLDFGGRVLKLFESLPHVGAVVLADETDRVNRLVRMLTAELETRKQLFSQVGVSSLSSYREATGAAIPALVVGLDNYSAFSLAYPDTEDQLVQVAREGGSYGIHLVVTGQSPMAIKTKLSSHISLAVALQLKDRGDYATVLGRSLPAGADVPALPGRGYVKGVRPLEFQTALPVQGETEAERSEGLRELGQAMSKAWAGPRPRPVAVMPREVGLIAQPQPGPGNDLAVAVGLDAETLEPIMADLQDGPYFMVVGPVQSGKTTLLHSWTLGLATRFSQERVHLYLVDFRGESLSPLRRLPHVRATMRDEAALREALGQVEEELKARRQAIETARAAAGDAFDDRAALAQYPALVFVLDEFDAYRDGVSNATKTQLEQLLRRERGLGLYLVAAGSSSSISGSFGDGLVKVLKEMQTGFLMGSTDANDQTLLSFRLPFGEGGKLQQAPGDGFMVRRGRYRRFRAATALTTSTSVSSWVNRIVEGEE